ARPRPHRRPGSRPGAPGARGGAARQAGRGRLPEDHARRQVGRADGDGLGRRGAGQGRLRRRAPDPRHRPPRRPSPLRGAGDDPRAAPCRRGDLRAGGSLLRPAATRRADGGGPARAAGHDLRSAPARTARHDLRPRHRHVVRVPGGAGRQALPPGLRPRAARACAVRRPGRLGDRADVPEHRPRRRRGGCAAARHRKARGVHARFPSHRGHRHGAPPGPHFSGLLPDPPPDRGHPGLPGEQGRGHPAHRPQPPRLARARIARRTLHPRGDPRALRGQPRRSPRLLRPPREGAAGGRGVVALRPRPRRGRVLRPRAGAGRRAATGPRPGRGAPGGAGRRTERSIGSAGRHAAYGGL
ncbi:MAG: hypothetical protein AVDCRST_MAG53-3213, partial [uncultured Solirubrobacteraceae bacterium]